MAADRLLGRREVAVAALAMVGSLLAAGGCSPDSEAPAQPQARATSATPAESPVPGRTIRNATPRPTPVSPSASPAGSASVSPSTSACAATVAGLSRSRQAAQVVTVPVDEANVAEVRGAVRIGVGGVLLFGRDGPANLGRELRELVAQAPGGIAPFVMSDEEGGGVQRLANLVGSLPWPRTLAATRSPEGIRAAAAATARRLRSVGVSMDLAPVLDLDAGAGPDTRNPAGRRSFSANPAVAGPAGVAFATGLLDGGVVPVVKHFPGLGAATANTDFAPASVPSLTALRRADLLPFRRAIAAGLPAVMMSHASVPGLTAGPASLSRAAVSGLLRGQLGFDGLVVTDSLSAEAIRAAGLSVPAAGVAALQAGSDLLLYGPAGPGAVSTAREVIAQIVRAVGEHRLPADRLSDAARRVLTAKHAGGC